MAYNHKDHFHKKAKQDGYVARSAYKLIEIQKKYRVFSATSSVLDLGCAPGAWGQVACAKMTNSGFYLGLDLEAVTLEIANATFLQMDANDFASSEYANKKFNCVLSDMAPKTSGVKVRDQARSLELIELVIAIADTQLANGGNLVFKVFEMPELKKVFNSLKKKYKRVERFRPQSTRKESEEIYFIALSKLET